MQINVLDLLYLASVIGGLLSGITIIAVLLRNRKRSLSDYLRRHQSHECHKCREGFLCDSAMRERPAPGR